MADCCGAKRCTCTLVAGPGVEIDGGGSTTNPYVISAPGGGSGTPTVIQAGDTPTVDTTITGTGTTADPVVVSSTVRLDATPPGGGTNLIQAGPEGLYAELDTACGLTGDGTTTAPLAAAVGTWPYTGCTPDTYAGNVYCDSTGQLRSEPRPVTDFQQQVIDDTYPATPVPTTAEAEIEVRDFTITNPDPCRPAFVVYEMELDVDFDIPPGGGAMAALGDDDMYYFENTGTTTMNKVHAQGCKVFNRTIPPGGTLSLPFSVRMGRGSGGATFDRIQTAQRCFIFVL
jgi:hypothetical protein